MSTDMPAGARLPEGLLEHAQALIARGGRRLLGIAGTPGSGKSTVAALLAEALGEQAVVVPMDGFHLANRELRRLQRQSRKGAADTFDVFGYQALLRRLRDQPAEETVYAPFFDRELEESLASAIPVSAQVPLIISEGNYLLLGEGPWQQTRALFDACWYVDVDAATRRRQLVARHMRYGRTQAEAEAWVDSTDEPNARSIEAWRARADRVIPWGQATGG
ncbi:nucleoside/nucleotide kinase family protein [Pseudomonas sp. dw_358]|uniref:nucleoside/nucleotide kinase family protein n=1 Tax=Pseudomonas sp. dw_358 TaxID=2720083 RepID=UPI001BD67ED7|nr:nucleoside/nucleotide kinase family protein [Pseudomonas sp. dw_358]